MSSNEPRPPAAVSVTTDPSSSKAESGVVLKEAVEGVVTVGGVTEEGALEVMQGSRLEAESGFTGESEL